MPLSSGSRLGSYEILSAIGAGGMGEVYRATDTNLRRQVAIKVLRETVGDDPERLARFQREAEVLAALNHPNIAHIHGLEKSDGTLALVMELVEGPTLAERIARGPIPVAEALSIAKQISEALEAAHERGIIHRDLKPANIKLTADETVKVLDFGLAKAMEKTPVSASVANSPTLSVLATQAGIIMGTAAYMSPEQAKGADTDQRSDVFSFGVVLYEMLTARQPFHGETAAEIMASVLIREPDLSALPSTINPRLGELIARCLDKQPKKRWQAIGDLRLELESIAAAPHRADTRASAIVPLPLWKRAVPVAVAIVLTAAATTLLHRWMGSSQPRKIVRFSLPAQDFRAASPAIAVSPDGTRLVYVAITGTDRSQLMFRDIADSEARPIAGTAIRGIILTPEFSPDGDFVAYYTIQDRSLKKIAVTGGAPVTLTTQLTTPGGRISWRGDAIAVAQVPGIVKVPANGGDPQVVVDIDPSSSAASPQIIDERGSVLFALAAASLSPDVSRWDRAQIILQTPDGARHVIVSGGADPYYLRSGHLVYTLGGSLLAVPFDTTTARITGGPTPVLEGVARAPSGVVAHAAISAGGTLIYVPGPATPSSARILGLIDVRDGKLVPLPIPPNSYMHPRVSPDGGRVAVASDDGKEGVIWVYDLNGRGPPRRLTFAGRNTFPVWTPDGQFVTYQSDQQGDNGLYLQRADGTGPIERLTRAAAGSEHFPDSWSPDGKILAFRVQSGTSSIWTVTRDGAQTMQPLLQMKDRSQVASHFAPDGKWIAYGSNELTGFGFQVFVQPFPPTGAKFQAESQTGSAPLWSRDGKRLFFAFTNRVFMIEVQANPQFSAGQPIEIPGTDASLTNTPTVRNFDLTPDGNQLLVVLTQPSDDRNPIGSGRQINVVLNWFEELKVRVPTK